MTSSDNMRDAAGFVFLGGLGNPGYPHMLIPINQMLLTVCLTANVVMQCDDAKVDIPTLVLCVKCNQLDLFTGNLLTEYKVLVPAL